MKDMQRFQVQYNLKAIPEVQEYLNVAFERARHHGDLQDLYRRRYGLAFVMCCGSLLTVSFIRSSRLVCWLNLSKQLIQALPPFLPMICGNFSTGRYGLKRRPHRIDLVVVYPPAAKLVVVVSWCLWFRVDISGIRISFWLTVDIWLLLFYLLHSTTPLHRLICSFSLRRLRLREDTSLTWTFFFF